MDSAYKDASRYAKVSTGVNILLAAGKLLAGWLGGSFALIADGLNSLADLGVSIGLWAGINVASRPPDDDHPYGHGKIEQEVSRLVSVAVLVAGGGILFSAYHRLGDVHGTPALYVILVAALTIPVKVWLYLHAKRKAGRNRSGAIESDAVNHLADVGATVSVILGTAVVFVYGEAYAWADDAAACCVGAIMVWMAAVDIHATSRQLLDEMPPPDVVEQVRLLVASFPGVTDVEKVVGRKSGLHYYIDLHLEVPGGMSVHDAHELSHRVKDWLMTAMEEIADVVIHVEPDE